MKQDHVYGKDPRRITRRDFLKLAAAAGILVGCSPRQRPTLTPTPTRAPIATPTVPPPAASPSKVVHTHHTGVWDGESLVPNALRQMLDSSITELTGLNDAREAWASLFDPGERVAIKVNAFSNSIIWTHVPLVMAVTECLQEVGVPAEQIVIFDYATSELEEAGYPVNREGPGVRCYGTDDDYVDGFRIAEADARLSKIVMDCDALINMPVLKSHMLAGITFAMKNHFGTFNRPASFHRPHTGPALVELNGLPAIKERTRLIVGDALTICPISRGGWSQAVNGDSILMSHDPVAHDAVGLQILCEVMASEGHDAAGARDLATSWLTNSAESGLGTNDPDLIDLIETTVG